MSQQAASEQPPLATESRGVVAMRNAAISIERMLAELAALLAELEALEPPRPGPDGKVNTAAQQAYEERLHELQGKIASAKNASRQERADDGERQRNAVRQVQVPVVSSGLSDPAEPSPESASVTAAGRG